MSWVEWVPPLMRLASARVRMVLRVAFVVAVVVNVDAVVALVQWLGEELTRARVDRLMESIHPPPSVGSSVGGTRVIGVASGAPLGP